MNKAIPILRKNRKSIETLIPNFRNSLKYIFPFSEFGKIGNLKGSPAHHPIQINAYFFKIKHQKTAPQSHIQKIRPL